MHKDEKKLEIPTTEEWIVKITELAEMAKLTYVVRDKTMCTFIRDWKLFAKNEKSELVIYGFSDQKRLNMKRRKIGCNFIDGKN